MKTYRNSKRFAFAILSNLFLICGLSKAAAYFDPLALHRVTGGIRPLPSVPCGWPDPQGDPAPSDPSPDCVVIDPNTMPAEIAARMERIAELKAALEWSKRNSK